MEKLTAFCWRGPGVLTIRVGARVRVVPPRGELSLVRESEDLQALGAERIQELLQAGQASEIKLDEPMEVEPDFLMSAEEAEEFAETQAVASESARESVRAYKLQEDALRHAAGA